MSEYKGIQGYTVQTLGQDPTKNFPGDLPNSGQVWYSGNGNFYLQKNILSQGTWASSSTMNSPRFNTMGCGTQTAALAFGGSTSDPTLGGANRVNFTEKYDGNGWTSVNPMNIARYGGGPVGTQTAALVGGGVNPTPLGGPAVSEKYDGTNWTAINSINTARILSAGAGTQTAALVFGSATTAATNVATEKYDGTNWTTVNSMNTGRGRSGGCGTQTAALVFGGLVPPATFYNSTEKYDGTNWTTVNPINTTRMGLAGAGTQTAALAFGGFVPPNSAATERYDGTNWTNITSINSGRRYLGGAGNVTTALAFGGNVVPPSSSRPGATEEYDANYTNKITIT